MEVIANAIETAWSGILGLTEKLVMPDWGALIGLLPVAVMALAILYLLILARRWFTAGPKQRSRGTSSTGVALSMKCTGAST